MLTLVTRILNGINFASYEFNNLVYKAKEIPHRQILDIQGLNGGNEYRFDFSDTLTYPLLITSVTGSIVYPRNNIPNFFAYNHDPSITDSFVLIKAYKKIDDSMVGMRRLTIGISNTPVPELFFSPDCYYIISANKPIDRLRFTGEPIYLLPTINQSTPSPSFVPVSNS